MSELREMPREKGLENGLEVLSEGYRYIPNRRQVYQSPVFETRLMGQKAYCMGGEEAAKLWYDEAFFKRAGAAPGFAKQTLLGETGVQTLDDEEHRHRKQTFLNLMSPDRKGEWKALVEKHLRNAIDEWNQKDEVQLYWEAQKVLSRAVFEWADVPIKEEEFEERTKQLVSLIEYPATLSPKHIQARMNRNSLEDWIGGYVENVRDEKLFPGRESALYQFSWHKDLDGEVLDTKTAAVEVLNILRPSIAIAIYFAFTGLALHQFPEEKEKLNGDNPYYLHMFIQELRRYFPFFPFNGAITRKDFVWEGYSFEEGVLTIFDFYGTNHDPHVWENPDLFQPERFKDWHTSPTDQIQYKLVAQGGGNYLEGHRCPGEWNTVAAMEVLADYLVNHITYDMPEQNITYELTNMPAIPKDGIVLTNVKWKEK